MGKANGEMEGQDNNDAGLLTKLIAQRVAFPPTTTTPHRPPAQHSSEYEEALPHLSSAAVLLVLLCLSSSPPATRALAVHPRECQ